MAILRSTMTESGEIAIPAEILRKLGIGPGSIIEWHEEGGRIVLRKAGSTKTVPLGRDDGEKSTTI